ncbi:unnamed protein product [Moneuplotes crassus]|uniref:Uncharacterized protein n=1 Tax=Euplotes crassus TaxID=5936 RepID=A0AAD2D798_EUPCR|nr:unnamed protein product [Moneuplotes crassus]
MERPMNINISIPKDRISQDIPLLPNPIVCLICGCIPLNHLVCDNCSVDFCEAHFYEKLYDNDFKSPCCGNTDIKVTSREVKIDDIQIKCYFSGRTNCNYEGPLGKLIKHEKSCFLKSE